jgi:CRP/FNR family transcriptional regulator
MRVRDEQGVMDAIARSSLGPLPSAVIEGLTDGAVPRKVPAGTTTHRQGDGPFFQLVVDGLMRAYIAVPDGRTMTIRYCRRGALMGTGTLFNDRGPRARGQVSALVDSDILVFDAEAVRAQADRDVEVARALLGEASARVADYINELEATALASVRQRLARHLLDLGADHQSGPHLVARASQQALADAVGSVREVVVRILHDLRDEGVVRTGRGNVQLLDPARLDAETYGHRR